MAENFVNIAGGVIALSGLTSILLSWMFCTRPAPRWARNWLQLAWVFIGVRLLTRNALPIEPDQYWVGLVYINAGAIGVIVAAWNFHAAFGPPQDRCPCDCDICRTDEQTARR